MTRPDLRAHEEGPPEPVPPITPEPQPPSGPQPMPPPMEDEPGAQPPIKLPGQPGAPERVGRLPGFQRY